MAAGAGLVVGLAVLARALAAGRWGRVLRERAIERGVRPVGAAVRRAVGVLGFGALLAGVAVVAHVTVLAGLSVAVLVVITSWAVTDLVITWRERYWDPERLGALLKRAPAEAVLVFDPPGTPQIRVKRVRTAKGALVLVYEGDELVQALHDPGELPDNRSVARLWRWFAELQPRKPNRRPGLTRIALRDARQAGVSPARVGTPRGNELLAGGGAVNWLIRLDGSPWIVPREAWVQFPWEYDYEARAEEMNHPVAALASERRAALAAGEAQAHTDQDDITGIAINNRSGYNRGNTARINRAQLAFARAAFAYWLFGAARTGGGSGGPLAGVPMSPQEIADFGAVLERLAERGGLRNIRALPFGARGPPVAVVDVEDVRSLLAEYGLSHLADQLVAFGWHHPVHAPDGLIVMFTHTWDELHGLTGRHGGLDAGWWQRLADHEVGFHLQHLRFVDGLDHDEHAAALLAELNRVRAMAWVAYTAIAGPTLDFLDPEAFGISGLDESIPDSRPIRGVKIVIGLNDRIRAAGGRGEALLWAHHDNYLYVDARALAAIRDGALPQSDIAAWLRHELTHLAHPEWTEEQV
ncbi:MAG: hypothetical protein J2P32_15915, partial [Actinobacteria bacterium]|nr:hypothetical protein [Actinomycetota bacterium]